VILAVSGSLRRGPVNGAALRAAAAAARSAGVVVEIGDWPRRLPPPAAVRCTAKPVALLSVGPPGRGAHVRHALELVLTALDAGDTYHSVPVTEAHRDAGGEIADPALVAALGSLVTDLAACARHAALTCRRSDRRYDASS
jgi:NAD(P)H-dependent FMN reductase